MKATELMINDLVQVDGVVRIATIRTGAVYDYMNKEYSIGCIKPIPLTPQILEKNGWKWDKYWELWIHKNIPYWELALNERFTWVIKTECYTDGERVAYLPFVHQLQHALHICELDELADNFKIN